MLAPELDSQLLAPQPLPKQPLTVGHFPAKCPGELSGIGAGLVVGIINGFFIVRLKILPFIATLATMLAANGSALLFAHDQTVSVSYDGSFVNLGQGDLYNIPIPAIIAVLAYIIGSVVLNFTSTGRSV